MKWCVRQHQAERAISRRDRRCDRRAHAPREEHDRTTRARQHALLLRRVLDRQAARGIEKTVLAVPPARRPPITALDLDREARPALAALSERIVAYAAQAAGDPEVLARTDPRRVADALDGTQAPEADRLAIGRAVVALRRIR